MLSAADGTDIRVLHWFARAALRVAPPARAKRIVDAVARFGAFRPRLAAADARERLDALGEHGTCLTRALAVGARIPSAAIVIGVGAPNKGRLVAHAWLIVDGDLIGRVPPGIQEIARLGCQGGRPGTPERVYTDGVGSTGLGR